MNESSRGLQLETEKQQVWRRVKESPGWRPRAGVEGGLRCLCYVHRHSRTRSHTHRLRAVTFTPALSQLCALDFSPPPSIPSLSLHPGLSFTLLHTCCFSVSNW